MGWIARHKDTLNGWGKSRYNSYEMPEASVSSHWPKGTFTNVLATHRFVVRWILSMPLVRTVWFYLTRVFYVNVEQQYVLIMVSGIVLLVLVMSGALMYKQVDPTDLSTRGKWYLKQGKAALAVQTFESLVRQRPYSYTAHLQLGNAYLETDQKEEAFKEFRTASKLRGGNPKETGAHVAIARMLISEHQYEDAQKQLFQALRAQPENRHDHDLQLAISMLYIDWANHLMREVTPPDYENAYRKLYWGLKLVTYKELQRPLIPLFSDCAERLSDRYSSEKRYDLAINVLKRALNYDNNPDKMMAIGAIYEQKADLDQAILWDRKLYDLEEERVRVKLATMLVQKGTELAQNHQLNKAKAYLEEAKTLSGSVEMPANILYPVDVSKVNFDYTWNERTHELTPKAVVSIRNMGQKPIKALAMRVVYNSVGNPVLSIDAPVVHSPRRPLLPPDQAEPARLVTLPADKPIPLKSLNSSELELEISVCYDNPNDKAANWIPIKTESVVIKELVALEKKSEMIQKRKAAAAAAKAKAAKEAADATKNQRIDLMPPEPTPVIQDAH